MLVLAVSALLASQAIAHGILSWPIQRTLPQDQQNGYTYDMGAVNVNLGPHPNGDMLCNYLPAGPVFTQTLTGGSATIDFNIMNSHQGGCIVYISTDNQKTWQQIGADPNCGKNPENSSRAGSINVTIPAGEYKAVIRWSYVANNGGEPENEAFGGCADVVVSAKGSNAHDSFLLLSQSEASQLPRSASQYWDQSCTAGATVCSGDDKHRFINTCVSLAASGGFTGGSSWYEYPCPLGTTCKTVRGVATCSK
ncbi:hypothetical protein BC830DRAFT_1232022 [Chytriomyces sp. MP71]|nr:hypothetical protein BC830DRAFT_1232022 [Chytriomyces sp. MP71]